MTSPTQIYIDSMQSDKSKVLMESRLKCIADILQGVSHSELNWTEVSYTEVIALLNKLKSEGKAPSTINNYLASIKGAAKEAWRCKQLPIEDYHHIKDVKRVSGSRATKGRALPTEEISKMVSSDKSDTTSLRDSAIIALTYGAGLRRSEVANLNINDIDFNRGEISILGKGNKEAVNSLPRASIEVVRQWLQVRGKQAGKLFLRIRRGNNLTQEGISDQSVYDIVKKRQKALGLEGMATHDLRRSYITHLLEAGNDVFTVQGLARHANVNTTQTYDKRNKSVQDNAAKGLSF